MDQDSDHDYNELTINGTSKMESIENGKRISRKCEDNRTDEADLGLILNEREEGEDDINHCGIFSFRPKCLQQFANNKSFLVVFCLTSIIQGMFYTYFVSMLTTIEKLFQVQSKTTGLIMSATEIGQIGAALLLTYYGGQGNRPKWIACGMIVFAVASLLGSIPHYLFKETISSNSTHLNQFNLRPSSLPLKIEDNLCYSQNLTHTFNTQDNFTHNRDFVVNSLPLSSSSSSLSSSQKCLSSHQTNRQTYQTNLVLSIFFVSLLLIGIGSTTVNNLGIPYMDDNVAPKESPLYFGLSCILLYNHNHN